MKIKVLLAMIACVAMLVACTDKAAEAETELWDTITRVASIGADSSKADHDYFLEHVTDNFNAVFGYPTVEDCAADI